MLHIIHSDEYENWVFDASHPTQGRRFVNGYNEIFRIARLEAIPVSVYLPYDADVEDLLLVHSEDYVSDVIGLGISDEWEGQRTDLSELAQLFVGGTLTALSLLLSKKASLVVHLPGAKHHAQYDRSSGFCVFNDFAIAAKIASGEHGAKVAILDIDAHHGDGVENLTKGDLNILTFSIHEYGIFPGTGNSSVEGDYYNYPLKKYDGDEQLIAGVYSFISMLEKRKVENNWIPDYLFITCGADGHLEDPLTNLEYSVEGYVKVARIIRDTFPELPILMGGAGGYLPDTRTPEIWAKFAVELARV